MNVINSSIAPIKVIKDKTYEIVARYILSYIFGKNEKKKFQKLTGFIVVFQLTNN